MLGQIVQFVLYGLLALVVMLGIAGLFLVFQVRRGLIRPEAAMKMPLVGLALIASTAPYIGLFGTVWHIIGAFGGLAAGNLNVAAIAQPIGESLYATLWGLASAIPAQIMHRVLIALVPDEAPSQSSQATETARSGGAQDSAK